MNYKTTKHKAQFVISHDNDEASIISDIKNKSGTTGLFELAKSWTDEFELRNYREEWSGDFLKRINKFLIDKLNE